MPASKVRKDAAATHKVEHSREVAGARTGRRSLAAPANRSWVPWVFVPLGLLGVAWLVVYYIAGTSVPGMRQLDQWNLLIGMGLLAASFGIATLWT